MNTVAGALALKADCSASEVKDTERYLPVALAAATLLGLGGVGISVSSFGEVAWKPRLALSSALGNAGVVAVSELVRTGH